jgi:hypothetical protein
MRRTGTDEAGRLFSTELILSHLRIRPPSSSVPVPSREPLNKWPTNSLPKALRGLQIRLCLLLQFDRPSHLFTRFHLSRRGLLP